MLSIGFLYWSYYEGKKIHFGKKNTFRKEKKHISKKKTFRKKNKFRKKKTHFGKNLRWHRFIVEETACHNFPFQALLFHSFVRFRSFFPPRLWHIWIIMMKQTGFIYAALGHRIIEIQCQKWNFVKFFSWLFRGRQCFQQVPSFNTVRILVLKRL